MLRAAAIGGRSGVRSHASRLVYHRLQLAADRSTSSSSLRPWRALVAAIRPPSIRDGARMRSSSSRGGGVSTGAGRCFFSSPTESGPDSATAGAVEGGDKTGWAPKDEEQLKKMAEQSLLLELNMRQQKVYRAVVEWFLTNMPTTYFRQCNEEVRLQHLQAITTMVNPSFFEKEVAPPAPGGEDVPLRHVALQFDRETPEGSEITFVQPGGLNLEMLDQLPPADGNLRNVKVFMSKDRSLAINVFTYKEACTVQPHRDAPPSPHDQHDHHPPAYLAQRAKLEGYARAIQNGEYEGDARHPPASPRLEPDALGEYLERCDVSYVSTSHRRRFLMQRELYDKVQGGDGVAVNVEQYDGMDSEVGSAGEVQQSMKSRCQPTWVTCALANTLPKVALQQALWLLPSKDMDIIRAHLDVVEDPGNGWVTMLRVLVLPKGVASGGEPSETEKLWNTPELWDPIVKDLKRLKWVDNFVINMAIHTHPSLGLDQCEVINTLSNMMYGVLHSENPWAFTRSQLVEWLENPRYLHSTKAISNLFMAKFDPHHPMPEGEVQARAQEIRSLMKGTIELHQAHQFFSAMLTGVLSTFRTNLYMPERYALALRIDPKILLTEEGLKTKEVPFGTFFVHGRRFSGFHNRFRDIARGGLRLVTPATREQVAIEGSRVFDEAYGLSYAQQLKNKDIPEGGAKAVVLIDNVDNTDKGKSHCKRKTVKAFTDSLLDLIVDTPETRHFIVDLLGKEELVYLGPDEQVIPDDINWIVNRAAQRGYPIPTAFMSSKPDAGINHKEFGVTSEGVFVFLDEALKSRGIDPSQEGSEAVTVKITGGPDGDVAGNIIKIMHREYGSRVKIVGVADGTGCAEDPGGLDLDELLHLVHKAAPIAAFSRSKLGPEGKLHTCDNEEGINARNSMHNRVKADAFVPAGGRPATVNESNYTDFLGEDGKPSSPLIVEGANLFITPGARQLLHDEAGVLIVKDSSANKCGVICSSFEIISSMLMDGDEFTENKDEIVEDVLTRLRVVARREARLLFRLKENYEGTLPHFSEEISNCINRLTDALLALLDQAAADPEQAEKSDEYSALLMPFFREHLPGKVVDMAFDRIPHRIPAQYVRNALASCVASHIVYTEGVPFINAQPDSTLAAFALDYVRKEGDVKALMRSIEGCQDVPEGDRKKVMGILRGGGVRSIMEVY